MRLGQADQAADFRTKIGTDVLFGEPSAEFLIVRPGRIVDHIVPPNGLGQDFALGRRKIFHARKLTETVLDVPEVVIVAARRRVGGDQLIVVHRDSYTAETTEMVDAPLMPGPRSHLSCISASRAADSSRNRPALPPASGCADLAARL